MGKNGKQKSQGDCRPRKPAVRSRSIGAHGIEEEKIAEGRKRKLELLCTSLVT